MNLLLANNFFNINENGKYCTQVFATATICNVEIERGEWSYSREKNPIEKRKSSPSAKRQKKN